MSNNNYSSSGGGIGFFGLLAILFIGLKLGHVIDWEWWLVLSPLWGPLTMVLAVMAVILAGAGVLAFGGWLLGAPTKKQKKPSWLR